MCVYIHTYLSTYIYARRKQSIDNLEFCYGRGRGPFWKLLRRRMKEAFWTSVHEPVGRDRFTGMTWLIHMCNVTHGHEPVGRDSFIWVTWLIHMCDVTHWNFVGRIQEDFWMCGHKPVGRDSFTCTPWRIHMCDVTHGHAPVGHDSFTWVTWTCGTWLIHMYDVTHSYVQRDSLKVITGRIKEAFWTSSNEPVERDTFTRVTWLIHMCNVTHCRVSVGRRHEAFWTVLWLWLVGSIKW